MAPLSQWLQLMLAEIARKREDLERAREEAARRESEARASALSSQWEAREARITSFLPVLTKRMARDRLTRQRVRPLR